MKYRWSREQAEFVSPYRVQKFWRDFIQRHPAAVVIHVTLPISEIRTNRLQRSRFPPHQPLLSSGFFTVLAWRCFSDAKLRRLSWADLSSDEFATRMIWGRGPRRRKRVAREGRGGALPRTRRPFQMLTMSCYPRKPPPCKCFFP